MKEGEQLDEGLLRLNFNGDWTLQELSEFLAVLRGAYGSILNFERSYEPDALRRQHHEWRRRWDYPGPFVVAPPWAFQPRPSKGERTSWTDQLALDGEPRLKAIHIASPGSLEVLGKKFPFGLIADFIEWASNRDLKRKKMELENALLQNQVLQGTVQVLQELGYPKREVRNLLTEHIARPLRALEPLLKEKEVRAAIEVTPRAENSSEESAPKGTRLVEIDGPPDE